ncbi:Bgt-2113 [Blumeria graminis f. sp. tritici]|uniref:tRNA (uracil(54)-C(5))-methyltransferase n=2 Tax=Blumeria graminis f. sp. tritici TaxID=62690 RepID=A0A061HD14_BLUGR|nr:tRNA methyltransferase [Blumeria graminis f. sp. tritici 96224]VDB87876.1 Bgt-2113 [Blumeria graminis f. sp. tritici]
MQSDHHENHGARDHQKRRWNGNKRSQNSGPKSKKSKSSKNVVGVDVLLHDVVALLEAQKLRDDSGQTRSEDDLITSETSNTDIQTSKTPDNTEASLSPQSSLPKPFTEIDVEVKEISSTGDGLAIHPESKRIYVVPFSVPGDVIRAKVIKHFNEEEYSTADFISVVKAGPLRDDSRVQCKYFSTCSGCQFQMLDYEDQLRHKKTIVEKAYMNFSQLPKEMIPPVDMTIGSPLQYGYRTKLTPHFDAPKGYISKADKLRGVKNHFKGVPKIGFNAKGASYTLDIEDCPIGTDAVRMGMKRERLRVASELEKYTKGATILLRESTLRLPKNETNISKTLPDTIKTIESNHIDFKSCVTENRAMTTEYVDNFIFTNIANEFFQNNNSILSPFTQYIRDHIMPPPSNQVKIKNLIDAYSGSGLFTITLSSLFESSIGIDVSAASISSATDNARQNNLPTSQANFMAADAATLFKEITYDPDETVVLIDPSRKGCDEAFLSQLLKFFPRRIVYVSCNVHTQARDVGIIVAGLEKNSGEEIESKKYDIESLVGFDFFPQTSHVEGVAVLNRVDKDEENSKLL